MGVVNKGPLFGCSPQSHRSWIVVKEVYRLWAGRQFHDMNININPVGKRLLGAAIENEKYREEYSIRKGSRIEKIVRNTNTNKMGSTEHQGS